MRKRGGISAMGFLCAIIGVVIVMLFLFQFAKASPILNNIEPPKTMTILEAEKIYLVIQENDKDALKDFL